jgi:hypothetical protein
LGIRYWVQDDSEFLAELAMELPYAQVTPSRHIEIYFSDLRCADPNLSCDQTSLYDEIFHADDGAYATGFAMDDLSESGIESLRITEAAWTEALPLK